MALQKQQWEAEMALQKQQLAKSRAKSGGSGKIVKNDLGGGGNDTKPKETPSVEKVLANVKTIQGPNVSSGVKDGLSGKTFSNIDQLLNYYGYAAID